MDERQLVAKKLRELRGTKTMEDVAWRVGISTSALGMYETGARMPRDEIKKRLAKYYGVEVGTLFFNE